MWVNTVMVLALVSDFMDHVHLGFGRCVHGFTVRCRLDMDFSIGNCLLTMYVQCGSIELARNLFDGMPMELITWACHTFFLCAREKLFGALRSVCLSVKSK